MVVTKATQDVIQHLIGECFRENRVLDRMCSVLGVQYAYNNTADLLHQYVAHYYPALADKIGEKCLERYNIPVYYEATPAGNQTYANVTDIIKDFEKHAIAFQEMFMGVCQVAMDNKDIAVYADLLPMLADVNRIVEQAILLSDKIDIYKDDVSYDNHVYKFWILGNDEKDDD